jgi:hypothetical protein
VAAHVQLTHPPTDTTSYEPLGTAGAYSGMERPAGDFLTHGEPRYERDLSDPFARKYYDLRFYPVDWDSPRPTAGGGGAPALIAEVVSSPTPSTANNVTVNVNTFSDGIAAGPDSGGPFPCIIPQLAAGETVPVGTTFLVTQAGDGNYYGQPPVWQA